MTTLDELRGRFWWLGPGAPGSYIVALDADVATIQIMDTSWAPRTRPYEEAVERDFGALGLRIKWVRVIGEKLENEISKARDKAKEAGEPFDDEAFKARRREEETKRGGAVGKSSRGS